MKKCLFLIFLFINFFTFLHSQTGIDSLETQLEKATSIERINILNELGKAYWQKSPQKTLEYGYQALELSQKLDYIEGEAQALKIIGGGYYYLSNYDEALECYQKSFKIYKEMDDKEGIASCVNNIGNIYYYFSNYDKALEYFLISLKIFEESGDKMKLSVILNNIGNIYSDFKDYDKALEYFQKALEIREEIDDKEGIAASFVNIGIIYWNLKNNSEALKYFQKSLSVYQEIENQHGIAVSLLNLGNICWESKDYNIAFEYFMKSLKKHEEIGNKRGIASSLINIGSVYVKLGNYRESLHYFERGLKLAEEIQAYDLIMHCYNAISELYLEKKDYKRALEYYKLYDTKKDSIFTEESSKKIAEMQVKYETEKKEKENEILKKDNKIQRLEINKQQNLRNSFIAISILVLILAFIIYTRYHSKQKTNIILNQKNTQIKNANTELNKKNKQITKQKNQLSKTLKELRETQKMLVDTAHRAGMAEIASGILHNVGNVLNSIKVSSQILKEKIERSRVNNLQKVLTLIEEHSADLGNYITSDEKGKLLPAYLIKVGETLKDEQDNFLNELSNLNKGINHIEEIVSVQQNYAGVFGLVESVSISNMMDDVLRMYHDSFQKSRIKVTKQYTQTTLIMIEKGKLMQVFVNLLKNSLESLIIKGEKDKTITIDIIEDKEKNSQIIEIIDNGSGILKNNLRKIFSYGYTTKKESKGFGLHTSALAISELKGKITAHSDGKNKGAKFTVIIPG